MESNITDLLRDCVVRVSVGQEHLVSGTGFFVGPGLILTCAHVIESQLSVSETKVKIFYKQTYYDAEIIKNFPGRFPDVALLGIDSLIENPCVLLNENINLGDQLYTFGFTDEYPDGDSVSLAYEGPTTISTQNDELKDFLLKMQFGQVRPGLSGAPLLNLRTGGVCAMVKSTRDREVDLGGRAVAISAILARMPHLNTQQRLFHQNNTLWSDLLSPSQKVTLHSSQEIIDRPISQTKEIETIKLHIDTQVNRIYSRFVSGSSRVTVRDLLKNESDLFIKFRWQSTNTESTKKVDIAKYILQSIPKSTNPNSIYDPFQKFLVLSDPGFGKSTLTYSIFGQLVKSFKQGDTLFVPIYINLQDYIGDEEFGTKEWTLRLLDDLAQSDKVNWARVKDSNGNTRLAAYFILDAIDEFLSGFTLNEVTSVLRKFIFSVACLVTCRKQYFERYLFMSDFALNFEKLYLSGWTRSDTDKYIRGYFLFCYEKNEAARFVEKVQKNLEKFPYLKELCQVPLRLNMTLELLSDNVTRPDSIFDNNSLYSTYILNWLARESSKVNSILSPEEKFQSLKVIAWNFYDEGRIGQDYQSNKFTRSELLRVLNKNKGKIDFIENEDINNVVEDLATRSVLIEEKGVNYGKEIPIIRFAHKSFLEYLVASFLNDLILGLSQEDVAEAFTRVISQEVTQFFKTYLTGMNDDKSLQRQAVENFIGAFNICQKNCSMGPVRQRIASGQLAYFMGHLNSTKILDFLIKHLKTETNLIIKRSIVVGLAFGGHQEYLNQYIERLRKARVDQIENEVNIGTHLSYFGDQPYDDLNPAQDQLIPKCKHTIEKLIYQLGTEVNRGSWRLDLYTLLDIGRYRYVSRKEYIETIRINIEDFKYVIENFKKDPSCREWPEIKDADLLISSIENYTDDFFSNLLKL